MDLQLPVRLRRDQTRQEKQRERERDTASPRLRCASAPTTRIDDRRTRSA
jgi:hypothetical protein